MASIANPGPSAGIRWTLAALLRRLQPSPRPRSIHTVVTVEAAGPPAAARPAKRRYAPQRDAVFEQSAMAREMFRL